MTKNYIGYWPIYVNLSAMVDSGDFDWPALDISLQTLIQPFFKNLYNIILCLIKISINTKIIIYNKCIIYYNYIN